MLTAAHSANGQNRDREQGFTLLEIMVVMLIMTIVVAIASTALYSLSQTANRNDAMVSEEQAASNIIAQLGRDVRSASSLSFPTGAVTANEVQLAVNQASGSTVPVLWVYNSTARTLSREVQVNGTFQVDQSLSNVANPSTASVFTYYTYSNSTSSPAMTNISTNATSDIAKCTTSIGVDVYVSSSTSGTATYQESEQVALTNQLITLTAPGTGQCAG